MLYIKLIPNEFVTDRWGIRSAAVKNSVEFFTPRDKSDRIFHTCEESVPWEIRFNTAVFHWNENYDLGYRNEKKCLRGIYGQGKPRSACASAQSDQALRCPFTELLDTVEYQMVWVPFEVYCIAILLVFQCRNYFCLKVAISSFWNPANACVLEGLVTYNKPAAPKKSRSAHMYAYNEGLDWHMHPSNLIRSFAFRW